VIVGIVNFLKQQTGKFPTSVDLTDLKGRQHETAV
jgi:hypothetical protein